MKRNAQKYDLNELYPTPEDDSPDVDLMGRLDDLYPESEPIPIADRKQKATVGRPVAAKNGARPAIVPRGAMAAGSAVSPRLGAALLALRVLLMSLGAVLSIAYLAAMPRWITIASAIVCALAWYCLYRMILEWRAR